MNKINSPLWHDTGEFQAATRSPDRNVVEGAFREEVRREQLTLATSIRGVIRAIESNMPRDPSTHAATSTARERLGEMDALARAINDLCADAEAFRMVELIRADGPLADYIRGLFAWTKSVIRALNELAVDLVAMAPDWGKLRERLEEAESFYLEAMEPDVLAQLNQVREQRSLNALGEQQEPADARVRARLDGLFLRATALQEGLRQRFG